MGVAYVRIVVLCKRVGVAHGCVLYKNGDIVKESGSAIWVWPTRILILCK